MANSDVITMKDSTANPAPLGLMGYRIPIEILNLHNRGFFLI